MSSVNLAKNLHPAKKAWKSFTNTLQSKLRALAKIPKAIRKATNRVIAWCHIHPQIPPKLRALARRSSTRPHSHRHHLYHRHKHQMSFTPVYGDELFLEPVSTGANEAANKAKEMVASSSGVNKAKGETTTMNVQKQQQHEALPRKSKASDAFNVSLLPQFRGVDERAEEFISKFREEMNLQRQQSILEFQEMLDRSA